MPLMNPWMRGSSPLTRGKQDLARQPPQGRGIIPAHAGKTGSWTPTIRQERDHPRSRGENSETASTYRAASGSSPLTRGKPNRPGEGGACRGIIPAHAGKTWPRNSKPWEMRAHPRSRGENGGPSSNGHPAQGSSPLTRGKPLTSILAALSRRLIPAHAGKTAVSR